MSNYVNNMTNEEIWEMLESKMRKNGLSAYMFSIPTLENIEGDIKWVKEQTYKANDVHNAIALAYKVGYLRAMKGRPFKFGEKKKKGGHWEPVDIDQVLKGACKVVEDCLCWHYEYLGRYKKGEDGKFYQWVEDNE